MRIYLEQEINRDISLLETAWCNSDTFVFVPDRSGVSLQWIADRVEKIPDALKKNHFILLTSGSTGMPKLIAGEKGRSENLVSLLHILQESDPVEETLLALPLTYCYAFVNQWLWSLVMKRRMIQTQGFSQPDSLKVNLLNAKNAMLCLIGAQIPMFKRNFGDDTLFPGVIRLHFAGGEFPQNDIETVKMFFPNAMIFNNYGCAEAMPRLTIRRLEESDDSCNVGRPIPGVKLKTGENGEILFRSPFSAVGWIDADGFTNVKDDLWVPTGDLGYEIDSGYWQLIGRTNEVFKRYGEKIALPHLMNTIKNNWHGLAVFYREKDPLGEDAHVLTLSPAPNNEQLHKILRSLRDNYPRAYWPLRLESVGSMPLLPNGKIDVGSLTKAPNKIIHWKQRIGKI